MSHSKERLFGAFFDFSQMMAPAPARQETGPAASKYSTCASVPFSGAQKGTGDFMANQKQGACGRVDIGGQAVLEGVMMKAPDAIPK